jgi:uncharacterized membrane protein
MAIGPVQILVIGFEDPQFKGEALAELKRLKENDIIRLVDLLVVHKKEDGTVERMQHSEMSDDEMREFGAVVGGLIGLGMDGEEGMTVGAATGADLAGGGHILGDESSWYVDDVIPPNTAAAIAIIEHKWAIPLREAIHSANGFHLADSWIHPVDLVALGILAAEEAGLNEAPDGDGSGESASADGEAAEAGAASSQSGA